MSSQVTENTNRESAVGLSRRLLLGKPQCIVIITRFTVSTYLVRLPKGSPVNQCLITRTDSEDLDFIFDYKERIPLAMESDIKLRELLMNILRDDISDVNSHI